jgi:hypothetical protein
MSGQYSLRSFLRNAPNALLQPYLAERGIGTGLDWKSMKETKIDPIFEAIQAAPEGPRAEVDRDFREIDALATEGGRRAIIEEGAFHGLELAESLTHKDHLEAAFWAFLGHPEVFRVASSFSYADNLPNRSWRKRIDLPYVEPATDESSQKRLGEAIAAYYRHKDGRGHICMVEHYRRGDRLYWFAYPQDYAITLVGYDDKGEFDRRTERPAFEVVFVHEPETQTLNLFVRGDKRTVEDLQTIWGRIILGEELGPPPHRGIVYELNPLKRRGFAFPVDPGSGIEEVRIKKLRLSVLGAGNKRIILEADVRDSKDAVYDLLEDVMAGERIPLDLVNLTQVTLQLVFRDGGRRGKQTLTFDVSYPSSCDLKHDPKDEIAREHLVKWGIDVSGHVIPDTEEG